MAPCPLIGWTRREAPPPDRRAARRQALPYWNQGGRDYAERKTNRQRGDPLPVAGATFLSAVKPVTPEAGPGGAVRVRGGLRSGGSGVSALAAGGRRGNGRRPAVQRRGETGGTLGMQLQRFACSCRGRQRAT